jgi:DNA invertase Pin-like site-specific DNA recombinase
MGATESAYNPFSVRAVLYCRVSTVEQAQNLSLATQEQACREYCARQGYTIDQVFIDAGESAKTVERPEFRRLLEHCRRAKGTLHAVVVYALTRFSRNSTDHHAITAVLRGLGISLRSVTEPIDDSPSGRLMEGILAAMAQFDNDARADRVRAGLHAAVARGRWCWQAPIGYRKADPRVGPSLVPDPDRAPAVRAAFELFAAGVRGRALLRQVTALGLRSKYRTAAHGGTSISRAYLFKLLRQRAYIGRIQPHGWPQEAIGDFVPLVTDALFARVQQLLAEKPQTRARRHRHQHVNHPDFPLRRFVRCACGTSLTGSWSTSRTKTRYAFYACPRGCRRFPKATLEQAFLAVLDTLAPRPGVWRLLERSVLDVWRTAQDDVATAQRAAQRLLETLQARARRLDEAFIEKQSIDEITYRTQRDALREHLAIATMELADATVEGIDVEGLLAFAQHALTHASTLWTAAGSVEDRVQVQWTFFPDGLTLAAGSKATQADGANPVTLFQPPTTCLRLFGLAPTSSAGTGLVDPARPTWNHVAGFLQSLAALRPAA